MSSATHPERPTRATRALLLTSAPEFAAAVDAAIALSASAAVIAVGVDTRGAGTMTSAQEAAIREQVVELVRRNLRGTDAVQHAGDELMILLPGIPTRVAQRIALRLCAGIRNHSFAALAGDRPRSGVTAAMGVAAVPEHGGSASVLLQAARATCASVALHGGDGSAVAPAHPGARARRDLEIDRFIGRAEESAKVRRLFDESIGGSPRALTVLAEAGLGRAAIIGQLEPEVRLRGGSLIVASARAGAVRTPYGVWRRLLRSLQRLPDAPTKAWLELMHLNPELPGSSEERAGSQFRLQEEISEYIRLAARSRPLVLLLEEMQWADTASWDALDHLLTTLERERLLVCLTVREDPGQTEIIERRKSMERIDCYQEVRLSRLTRDEVKRWLEAAMQRQEIGRELLAYLYRHTEGSPLFITQLVSCMVEEGYIRHNGERWEWSPVSELQLGSDLDDIIRRRAARLSAATREILDTAAVAGRDFDLDVILSAAEAPASVVRAAIDEAIAAGIVRPTFERDGKGFSFSHVIVADAIAAAVPADRLSRAHEVVGRALRDRPGVLTETTQHFDLAGCSAEAYQCAMQAALEAESVYSPDAAGELLQIAARNATSPAELAEVRVRLAQLAEVLGRFDEVEELCDLAIEWYSGQGDRLQALRLRRMRERAWRELGQPARTTLEALRELDEEAKALGSDRERIEILTMESQTYARLADHATAEKLAEECVAMAERVSDPALLAAALNRLGITIRNESPKRARAYFERALALFQRLGDVRGQSGCHNNLGIVAQLEMRPDHGRESLTMAMTLARAAGIPDLSGTAAMNLGVIVQRMGDAQRARELYGTALSLFAAVKNSELQLYALYNMANLDRETGAYESSAELWEATSSLAQRIGQSDVEIGAMAGEALCLLALGKIEAVRVLCAEIERRLSERQGWFQGREMVDALLVKTSIVEGRLPEAMETFEKARKVAEEYDMYAVAWLTAACADQLMPHYPDQILAAVQKYSGQVSTLGYTDLIRKYEAIQGTPARSAG